MIRFRRAGGRCEGCDRPHGRVVLHLGDGRWWDDTARTWRDGAGRRVRSQLLPAVGRPQPGFPGWPAERHGPPGLSTRVVLATAHLDHDPTNNAAANLAALCQRCHLLNDAPEHRRRRAVTVLAGRACEDLFTGGVWLSCPEQGDTLPGMLVWGGMPARHTLHVALTEPLVLHVRSQVAAGRYENASEAVRRALQLLIEQERAAERAPRLSHLSAHRHG